MENQKTPTLVIFSKLMRGIRSGAFNDGRQLTPEERRLQAAVNLVFDVKHALRHAYEIGDHNQQNVVSALEEAEKSGLTPSDMEVIFAAVAKQTCVNVMNCPE